MEPRCDTSHHWWNRIKTKITNWKKKSDLRLGTYCTIPRRVQPRHLGPHCRTRWHPSRRIWAMAIGGLRMDSPSHPSRQHNPLFHRNGSLLKGSEPHHIGMPCWDRHWSNWSARRSTIKKPTKFLTETWPNQSQTISIFMYNTTEQFFFQEKSIYSLFFSQIPKLMIPTKKYRHGLHKTGKKTTKNSKFF